MPKVCFKDSKFQPLEVNSEMPLLQQLQAYKLPIASSCGGEGTCNKCVIEVLEGHNNLSEVGTTEAQLKKKFHLKESERVACQAYVLGPIKITTSYW
ncbi:MAG: (2Fe-2S)-binding protein [Bdellovibrionales bacterium]|nr:(2Fe-2S)-binding protein [Bdellovibrionales bacterium]